MTKDLEEIVARLKGDVFYGDVRLARIGEHNPLHKDAADAIEQLQADKDAAYHERNLLVAALTDLFPAGIARTDIPGWDREWHGCVYVDLPTGQASWHYHDRETELFSHLPPYPKPWDGHTTEEKYRRLAALSAAGYVIVKREPDMAAIEAGVVAVYGDAPIDKYMREEVSASYDAMLSASQPKWE